MTRTVTSDIAIFIAVFAFAAVLGFVTNIGFTRMAFIALAMVVIILGVWGVDP